MPKDEENFTVLKLLDLDSHSKEHDALNLKCLGGRKGLNREISKPEINHPGLSLAGFFEWFGHDRLQIFGRGEAAYIEKLDAENNLESIHQMFDYAIPCCIFTHSLSPVKAFFEIAEQKNCPILQTDLPTAEFVTRIIRILSTRFCPKQTIHGVLVEVYGIGILIQGASGIGKSEIALELIMRGRHRLVADDMVKVYCVNGNILMGAGANKIIGHHMEIRGLGILNITHLFGMRSIRESIHIQLVVSLEEGDPKKMYDRIGIDEKVVEILGVSIPKLEIPVGSGRHIPTIIETAALNQRLKDMGYNAPQEFNQNILKWIETDTARSVYFGSEDII